MGLLDAPALSPKQAAKDYERVGYRAVSMRGKVGSNQSNGTDTSQTSRTRWVVRGDNGGIKLVFANFRLPSGSNEPTNPYTVSVKASIEDPSVSTGSPTGAILIPVFFNGKRTGTMEPGAVLVSDEVFVNAPSGSVLWLRCCATVASGDRWVNHFAASSNIAANPDGGGASEGAVANTDATDSGTVSAGNVNAFVPVCIIGRPTAESRVPAVMIAGDSIASETGILYAGGRSYMTRACMNAGYSTIGLGEGGERFSHVVQQALYWKRMQLATYSTHVLSNYGTNDIYSGGYSLAQMKTVALSAWKLWHRLGLKVHQLTVLPRPGTSTDGYMTVAGQTIADAGKEAVRTGFNAWLLDTSASGAVAQSDGTLLGVIDPTVGYEVNSSGVPTIGGGYWKSAGAVVTSGTATGVTSTVITDSGKARGTNADVGLVLAILTATTGAGQSQTILSNTATAWTLLGALTTTPTGTVTYQVGPSYNYDGTHPTGLFHAERGDSLDVSSIDL